MTNFTGNYTRLITDGRSYSANGTWTGSGALVASWLNASGIVACESTDLIPAVPENETICSTGEVDSYYLSGEVIANGRMTAEGTVTLRKELVGENFEGSGTFEGIGQINGTGQFIGSGYFSGDIVNPGSFYLSDMVPGEYQVTVVLPSNRTHVMEQSMTVPVTTVDADLSIPGFLFSDVLSMDDGTPVANQTMEVVDATFGNSDSVTITTDENGSFSHGPILPGEYYWRVDIDSDGLYDANSTFFINEGDEANVTLRDGLGVPYMTDVTVQLRAVNNTGASLLDVANRVVTFTNIEILPGEVVAQTFNVTSNASGMIHVELTQGTWIASDDGDDLHVLWQEVEVSSDNQSGITWDYTESAWVNGTVYLPNLETDLDNLTSANFDEGKYEKASTSLYVHFRSGNIDLEAVTNITGQFSMRLPVDRTFHVTAIDSFSKASAGVLLTNAADGIYYNDIANALFLEETSFVSGLISLRTENITWDSTIPGWEPIEVIATNADGLEWRNEITTKGDFTFDLQPGLWNFSLSNSSMNAPAFSNYSVAKSGNNSLNFIAEPANVSVTLRIYLDHDSERSWENGTAVKPDVSLVPTGPHGIALNLTAADYNLAGELIANVSIGSYSVIIEEFNANDENATDYSSTKLDQIPELQVGLDENVEAFEIALEPMWLVTGIVVEDDNATGLNNSRIYYMDANDESVFYDLQTDENGSFAKYVPQGDWIFMIHPFTSESSNISEIYRQHIVVNETTENRIDLHFRTIPVVQANLTLKESLTGDLIVGQRVEAVSLDGYGNVSSDLTDDNGSIIIDLLPGDWTLYVSNSDDILRENLLLEEGVITFSTTSAVAGVVELGDVNVNLTVEISGKVYWDNTVGISEVNVTVLGGIINETIETNSDGVWSLYVPIQETYNVSASKVGFETVFYNNQSGISVANLSLNNQDMEMTAGLVSVSGNVTDLIDVTRLDGASITLYPEVGLDRDLIIISGTLDSGVLSWNADVTPGSWTVVVLEENPGPNGGGVAVGLLEASIDSGGTIDLEMSQGGRVGVSTSWTDLQLQEHNASDSLITEPVRVVVDVGDGQSWYLNVTETGGLDLILPIGTVTVSADFSTVEHDLAIGMNYTGAKTAQVLDDPLDIVLELNRRVVSDLAMNVVSFAGANGNLTDLTAIESGTEYQVIELEIEVNYDGNQISDTFIASGSVGADDGSKWTVQFKNGSADEWIDNIDLTLGIGANNSDTNQDLQTVIKARITLPAQNESFAIGGHTVSIILNTGSAPSVLPINVTVPQNYSIGISDVETSIGVADNNVGSGTIMDFMIENYGNGEDQITPSAELPANCIADGWNIEPSNPPPLPVEPRDNKNQKFTIYSPTSGATVESCDVTIRLVSTSGESVESTISAKISVADLSIDTSLITPLVSDSVAGEAGVFTIPVKNDGFLAATGIEVTLVGTDGTDFASETVVLTIPAESTVNAEFDYTGFEVGPQRFEITINPRDTPVANELEPQSFNREFANVAVGEESTYLPFIVVILGLLVVFGGYKVAYSGSKKRF